MYIFQGMVVISESESSSSSVVFSGLSPFNDKFLGPGIFLSVFQLFGFRGKLIGQRFVR